MMKVKRHGPSLYYASDKNVYDALNQHKVDISTIVELFERRNIVVSKKTPRDELARYFARQIHDYQDHQEIAKKLGVTSRRERITSMDVRGVVSSDEIQSAITALKKELEQAGEVVQVKRIDDRIVVQVQYTTIDYKASEFAQCQVRDGSIELIPESGGYVIRNSQNEYINDVRDTLIAQIDSLIEKPLETATVSLFDVPDHELRSRFFYDLAFELPGFKTANVSAVYVFKPKPVMSEDADEDVETSEPHIERVHLRGQGVTKSELLHELLEDEDYYITKIVWRTGEIMGAGHDYDIEAAFTNPKECTGFSFILSGVYPLEDGRVSKHRRQPMKDEIDAISRVIETKARELILALRQEHEQKSEGVIDAD